MPASFFYRILFDDKDDGGVKAVAFPPRGSVTARFQFFKFIYLTRNLFVVRIFLETLLGSPAQVNCVPDKILFDKSLRLIFFE